MRHQHFKQKYRQKESQAEGFALPLVIILGSVVLLGSVSTLGKVVSGKLGSVRQMQATQAREIAQAGLAAVRESLNHDYPYQLINQYSPSTEGDFGTWSNPSLPSARCPGSVESGHPATVADSSIHNGQYKIESYQFDGTRFYGGTGQLTITGERRSSSDQTLLASATITTSFDIKPKNCDARFGDPSTSSGFPGLLGWDINLGGNDVLGRISGNVLCIDCQELRDFGANKNSVVDGEKFMGPINVPPVPTFPSDLRKRVEKKSITTAQTITAGQSNEGMCATDRNSPPITHCLIETINLKRGFLTVDSAAGPVRLYVSGDVSAGGKSGIIHRAGSNAFPEPARLSLFGNPRDDSSRTHQTVMLSGVSKPAKAANLFVFVPDGTVGINGGAQGSAICDQETGECGGGDIHGAVWAQEWDGSNSNNAQLVVPPDMGDQLFRHHGKDFAIGISEFTAIGTNSYISQQGK